MLVILESFKQGRRSPTIQVEQDTELERLKPTVTNFDTACSRGSFELLS